jgi:hypothetical protein
VNHISVVKGPSKSKSRLRAAAAAGGRRRLRIVGAHRRCLLPAHLYDEKSKKEIDVSGGANAEEAG